MNQNDMALENLKRVVREELALPLPDGITTMAATIAARGHGAAVAVLFYGSNLRSGDLDGILDFYVLVDSLRTWYRRGFPAAANHLLPPSILYFEQPYDGLTLRAKVAVLRLDQFHGAMSAGSLDTTMWARYCQPAGLAWVRDADGARACVDAISLAVVSAARWAAALGPETGRAEDFWAALFRRTYRAELRVESATRASTITSWAEARYANLLPLAWRIGGVRYEADGADTFRPAITPARRRAAERGWRLRHLLGKPLNFVRLMKSAYTFDGGVDYVLWKIERHSGVRFEPRPWQRRHPILAAPSVLWQLRRRGAIR